MSANTQENRPCYTTGRQSPLDLRATAATLTAFALLGGLVQILASVALGLARLDALTLAANEGPTMYLVAAAAITTGLVVMWTLRRRPMIAALAFLVWQVAILWPLSRRMSVLGLALHGEFILHHFVTLLAAGACTLLGVHLVLARSRGALRWPIATLVLVGVLAAMAAHLLGVRETTRVADPLRAVAVSALLAGTIGWAIDEVRRGASVARWAVIPLLLPIVLRVVLVGPRALDEAPVPPTWRTVFMVTLVGCAVALAIVLRPRPPRVVAIAMTVLSALSVATLYLVYRRGFAEVEDGLGGLAQSVLGFVPPYPEYVSNLVIVVVMLGAFVALQTAGGALTSEDARDRGIGLALVLVAGLGWSNPQLVLMSTAGALLFIADLDEPALPIRGPTTPIADVLAQVGERLGLELSTIASDRRGKRTLHALRGRVRGIAVDVRAELDGAQPRVGARIGTLGRSRPEVALQPSPGDAGERPAHAIGRTHRIVGNPRALERWGDGVLDVCRPFPTLRIGMWPGGVELDLGADLGELDAEHLVALVDALVTALADD